MGEQSIQSGTKTLGLVLAVVCAIVMFSAPTSTVAAPRRVLVEEFTSQY